MFMSVVKEQYHSDQMSALHFVTLLVKSKGPSSVPKKKKKKRKYSKMLPFVFLITSLSILCCKSVLTMIFRLDIRQCFLYRFAGDVAELGIIRAGSFMKVKVVLNPRVHLVTLLETWIST